MLVGISACFFLLVYLQWDANKTGCQWKYPSDNEFQNDPTVIGAWRAVDQVNDVEHFQPGYRQCPDPCTFKTATSLAPATRFRALNIETSIQPR